MSTPGVTTEESARLNGLWLVAERAGLHRCSALLESRLMGFEEALDARRVAKAELDQAQADWEDAAGMARADIARRVRKEGAKTLIPEGDTERQVSADEAKAWVERSVAAADDVGVYVKALAVARAGLEEASDSVLVAERRIQAARYQTDAAVTLTNLLGAAFKENTK